MPILNSTNLSSGTYIDMPYDWGNISTTSTMKSSSDSTIYGWAKKRGNEISYDGINYLT